MTNERRQPRSAAERREAQNGHEAVVAGPAGPAEDAGGEEGAGVGEGAGVEGSGADRPAEGAGRRTRKPRPDLEAGKSRLHCTISIPVRYALECARWEFNTSISDIVDKAVADYLERQGISVAPVSGDAAAPASQAR